MRRALPVVAVLAAVAGLAGCGDDGGAGRLSGGEFRDRAQAICKDGNAAIDELAADFGKDGPTQAQLEEAAPKVPVLMGHELDRLAALEPPADLADDVDAMLAAFRAVLRTMKEQGPAFFEREDDPFADAYAKAADLGLDECAH